jgi:glyoxylase-like metal-dependent hydrolase (beta-lactamase superfamily II)
MSTKPIRIELSLGLMFQTVNCYLIPGDQLTLIDCGLYSEENWQDLQEKINAHGYKLNDIAQVIITHEHRDHTGLLPEIMARTNAIIRVPKAIEGWFSRPDEMKIKQAAFNLKLFKSLGFPAAQLEQVAQYFANEIMGRKIAAMDRFHFYAEGDLLRIGEEDWEVLNTPGHCPNQFVFLQKEQKRIFGSDMLLPITPMPIVVESPNQLGIPTRSLQDLLKSFARLLKFDLQTVYPGHGNVFTNANAMIEQQLARIEIRKEECYEAIKSGCSTPFQINRKMYPYQMMPPDFSGMFMVLGYLDLLEEAGRVKKVYDEDESITLHL